MKMKKRIKETISEIEANASTFGHKKAMQFFADKEPTAEFQSRLQNIRSKCGIPDEGFTAYIEEGGDNREINDTIFKIMRDTSFIEDAGMFRKWLGLDYSWNLSMQAYLIFDSFTGDFASMFYVDDLGESISQHPIALKISPYAEKSDIIDYVKKMYEVSIKPIQIKYRDPKITLGKSRKKNPKIKARNKYIYDNRLDYTSKELIELINKRFGEILDQGHIGKIISDERKKRASPEIS